ncbi:MAG: DUF4129 domain-containing protein [Acidimicrobiales bacterium]
MTRRAAIVVGSLFSALLAVAAAASAQTGSTVETNRAVQSDVVSVALTLFGFVSLAILASLVRTFAGRAGNKDGADEKRHARLAEALGLLLAFGLVVVVALVLARSGHQHQAHPALGGAGRPFTRAKRAKPLPLNASASIATTAVIVVLAAVALGRRHLAALLGRRGLFSYRLSHLRTPVAAPVEPDTEPTPALLVSRRPLGDPATEPDPRRAVVLAYLCFTAFMARAGARRAEHETPFEFSRRLFATGQMTEPAGQQATDDLTLLFSTARYSKEPLSAGDRRRALEDLAVLTNRTLLDGSAGSLS